MINNKTNMSTPTIDPAEQKTYNCTTTRILGSPTFAGSVLIPSHTTIIKYADPLSYNDLLSLEAQVANLAAQLAQSSGGSINLPETGPTFCERYKGAQRSLKALEKILENPAANQ